MLASMTGQTRNVTRIRAGTESLWEYRAGGKKGKHASSRIPKSSMGGRARKLRGMRPPSDIYNTWYIIFRVSPLKCSLLRFFSKYADPNLLWGYSPRWRLSRAETRL